MKIYLTYSSAISFSAIVNIKRQSYIQGYSIVACNFIFRDKHISLVTNLNQGFCFEPRADCKCTANCTATCLFGS
ncbi:MAG: hypothetical protein EAY75_12865 [Bacteroidetes bacterium]|nr:MAG: hypothetical protein EAY75_12865 [Bacteroidota bacterium]